MQSNSQIKDLHSPQPRITVLGLGGGGCNTINRLFSLRLPGIHLVAANTDAVGFKCLLSR